MKKIQYSLFFLLIILLVPVWVNAATVVNTDSNTICVNGRLYDVSDRGKYVLTAKIDSSNFNAYLDGEISSKTGYEPNYATTLRDYYDMISLLYSKTPKNFQDDILQISKDVKKNENVTLTQEYCDNYPGAFDEGSFIRSICADYSNVFNGVRYPEIYVEELDITLPAVKGILSPEEYKEWQFKVVDLNKQCTRTNVEYDSDGSVHKYEYTSCPTEDLLEVYGIDKIKNALKKDDGNAIMWNGSKYYMQFDSTFNGNIMFRRVKGTDNANTEGYASNYYPSSEFTVIGEDTTLDIGGVSTLVDDKGNPKGENVVFEFYLKPDASTGACQGSYLGRFSVGVPRYYYNNAKDYTICENFRNDSQIPENYKKNLVPECYNDSYMPEEAGNYTETNIRNKINYAYSLFIPQTYSGTDFENTLLQCHYIRDENNNINRATSTFVMFPENPTSYTWIAKCTETVEVTYDTPKAVIPGSGFPYNTTVEVTRTCTPELIASVSKLTECKYAVECWYGPGNHSGEQIAGPNEEFDECVLNCDNGEYSQECINACYSNVYENDNNLAISYGRDFLLSAEERLETLTQIANTSSSSYVPSECKTLTAKTPNYCYAYEDNLEWNWQSNRNNTDASTYETTPFGNYIYGLATEHASGGRPTLTSLHNIEFWFANTCNDPLNPTRCFEVYTSKPRPYCSDNPDLDYIASSDAAEAEYNVLLEQMKKYIYKTGEDTREGDIFNVTIRDSYLPDGKGTLETIFSNADKTDSKYRLNVTETVQEDDKAIVKASGAVNVGNYSQTLHTVEVSKSYTIDLAHTKLDIETGKIIYTGTNSIEGDNNITDYLYGKMFYYTDLNSDIMNDWRYWLDGRYIDTGFKPDGTFDDPEHATKQVDWNIHVLFENIGTRHNDGSYSWENINIDCFYGLVEDPPECKDEPCPSPGETPTLTPSPTPTSTSTPSPTPTSTPSPTPSLCDPPVCTPGLRYMFREVDLNNLFPGRDPRWNWTYEATVDDYGYYSNPAQAIDEIQGLGNGAYTETPEYVITLTGQNIRDIRKKNKELGNYLNYDLGDCYLINGRRICKSNLFIGQQYVSSFTNNKIGANQ